jgi:DNA (cytosine-5)-methyltransferase 1
MTEPIFLVVDLFCGAGGTTTGFAMAELEGSGIAKVIACVNHDPLAIKSHWANHPEVKHFEEDIRTLDLTELTKIVKTESGKSPNAKLILWASLECTNFSKAKGGQPRDADSRTLADHLDRYIIALEPDYIQIENVVEFMSWGPLDEKGKPISRKNGSDWMRWRNLICSHGYVNEWKELNAANFGAFTSRNRLFGVFARPWLPVVFPQPTHAKNPTKHSMYGDFHKWKAVKEVLDFADEGESIFTRKKPLSDKTLERIYAGLVKYVAKGDKAFISKYYSGRPAGKVNSVEQPASTVTTFGSQTVVQAKKFSDLSIDQPAGTVTTKDHHALVQTKFLTSYYGNGFNSSVEEPSPTVTTKDRSALIQPEFLVNYNHSSETNDVNDPAPTLVTKDKLAKVKPQYFIDKHYGNAAQNQSIRSTCRYHSSN